MFERQSTTNFEGSAKVARNDISGLTDIIINGSMRLDKQMKEFMKDNNIKREKTVQVGLTLPKKKKKLKKPAAISNV